MSTELQLISVAPAGAAAPARRSDAWLRAARRAKLLAFASLVWMGMEGVIGTIAGLQAHSLGVATWAATSFVEALASLIVVWRFTGLRTLSATSEAKAQRWVAATFFLLAPYFVIEAIRKLVSGDATETRPLAIAVTASAIAFMPLLGWAKLRLGRQLDSGATSGEGVQNLMCAVQAAAALVAIIGAGAGLDLLDPLAALAIAGIALKEGRDGWRGEDSCCASVPGLAAATSPTRGCVDDCCAGGRQTPT